MSIATRARLVGVVYLLYFVTVIAGALLARGTGDLQAHEATYELGVALGIISTVLYVALAALFYVLFRPVNTTLALVMAFLSVAGSAVTAVASVFQLAPVLIVDGGSYLSVFDVKQLQALASLSLHLSAETGHVALAFFGFFQLVWGYLIFRSTFLPRVIGVLIAGAGVRWLTYLLPMQPTYVVTSTEVLGFAAEASLMLWLLVMGVNGTRWNELSGRAQ